MSFIGKETFREGNIWLEGGGGGLPFSPFLFAYTDDMGDPSTFTKVAAPPVPVSTEFRTWFGFTYREDLPDTFTSDDGYPSEFSMTVADVTARGGAFIDYGGGGSPMSLAEMPSDAQIASDAGTSDAYPAGTSVTWSVLDADMTVIGERTIPFGSGGGGGAIQSALYLANYETMLHEIYTGPLDFTDTQQMALVLWLGTPPDSFDPNAGGGMETGSLSIGEAFAAGPWMLGASSDAVEPFDLTAYHDQGYGTYPLMMVGGTLQNSASPEVYTFRLALGTDDTFTTTSTDTTLNYTVTHQPQPYPLQLGISDKHAFLTDINSTHPDTLDVDWGEGDGFVTEDMTVLNGQTQHDYATTGTFPLKAKTPDPYWLDVALDARCLGSAHVAPAAFAAAGSSAITFTITADIPLIAGDQVQVSNDSGTINEQGGTPNGSGGLTFNLPIDATAGDRVVFGVVSSDGSFTSNYATITPT